MKDQRPLLGKATVASPLSSDGTTNVHKTRYYSLHRRVDRWNMADIAEIVLREVRVRLPTRRYDFPMFPSVAVNASLLVAHGYLKRGGDCAYSPRLFAASLLQSVQLYLTAR